MKVLFINPNLGGAPSLNLGLAYVISAAQEKHEVKLLDLNFSGLNRLKRVRDEIQVFRPAVIAFSATTFTFPESLRIANFIKNTFPGILVVFGGVHPTLLAQETIGESAVDAICIGEGERSFPEYLDRLSLAQEPAVAGIWYKDKCGSVQRNEPRPFREDIDGLAFPDWDHWELEKYLQTNLYYLPGALKFLASRGCPYDCSFCSNQAIKKIIPGNYYRVRSPEALIAEIKFNHEKYAARGFKSIVFGDEIFGLDPRWLREFCASYQKEGLSYKLPWSVSTRADLVTQEWAFTVAAAGCRMVMLGVESGDDWIRTQVYKKEISREEITSAAVNLRNQGVPFGFYLLVGCPQDSRSSIRASLRLVQKLKPVVSHFSFYQPLPGTDLLSSVESRLWGKHRELDGYWNVPRISTFNLSRASLRRLMWVIRLTESIRFLKLGWELKKIIFIADIFKYFLAPANWKNLLLVKLHFKSDLQQKTIFKYIVQTKGANL